MWFQVHFRNVVLCYPHRGILQCGGRVPLVRVVGSSLPCCAESLPSGLLSWDFTYFTYFTYVYLCFLQFTFVSVQAHIALETEAGRPKHTDEGCRAVPLFAVLCQVPESLQIPSVVTVVLLQSAIVTVPQNKPCFLSFLPSKAIKCCRLSFRRYAFQTHSYFTEQRVFCCTKMYIKYSTEAKITLFKIG